MLISIYDKFPRGKALMRPGALFMGVSSVVKGSGGILVST